MSKQSGKPTENGTGRGSALGGLGTGHGKGSVGTRFQKGNPGPRGLRKTRGGKMGRKQPQPSQLLRDMRRVYERPEGQDKTEGQRHCRALLKEDPKAFLSQMALLEKAFLGSGKNAEPSSPSQALGKDEGQEEVLELIEELLKGYEDERSQVTCPNCQRQFKAE